MASPFFRVFIGYRPCLLLEIEFRFLRECKLLTPLHRQQEGHQNMSGSSSTADGLAVQQKRLELGFAERSASRRLGTSGAVQELDGRIGDRCAMNAVHEHLAQDIGGAI